MAKRKEEVPKIKDEEIIQEAKKPPEVIIPVTISDYIKQGWNTVPQSENLQKTGRAVLEIKVVEGQTLHRLEK